MTSKKAKSEIDVQIGSRVRSRRMQLGISQEKLGDHLGLTFQQVQKYEKGANRIAGSRLIAIATFLRMTPADLLGTDAATGRPEDDPMVLLDKRGAHRLVAAYNRIENNAAAAFVVECAELIAKLDEESNGRSGDRRKNAKRN